MMMVEDFTEDLSDGLPSLRDATDNFAHDRDSCLHRHGRALTFLNIILVGQFSEYRIRESTGIEHTVSSYRTKRYVRSYTLSISREAYSSDHLA